MRVADALLQNYLQDENPQHLDGAIWYLQDFLRGTERDSLQFPNVVSRLGSLSALRYKATKQDQSFDEVIKLSRHVWKSGRSYHSVTKAVCLHHLGMHLDWQFDKTGDMSLLEEAVRAQEEVVRLEGKESLNSLKYIINLGLYLWKMYQKTENLTHLDESIKFGRLVLELEPAEQRHLHLDHVSLRLEERYKLLNEMKDLDDAIEFTKKAIEISPKGHSALGDYLESLAANLRKRNKLSPTLTDAQEAAQAQRKALELLGNSRSDRANMLFGLGIDMQRLYELRGDMSDLNASIEAYQQASELFPENHSSRSIITSEIGSNFRQRFERSGDVSDIETSIQFARIAISRAKADTSKLADASKLDSTVNLALSLGKRYEAFKKTEDLYEAIELERQAIVMASTQNNGQDYIANNLGADLLLLYFHTQEQETLKEAILLLRGSVDRTDRTPFERQVRASCLANLGVGLLRQYQLLGTMEDLDEAMSTLREALTMLPNNHKDRSSVLYNLEEALKCFYMKTRDGSDRHIMAEITQQLDNPDCGRLLGELYSITGDVTYIEDELRESQKLLDDMPLDDPNRAKYLCDYSWVFSAYFEAVGHHESLEMAVKMARQGVASSVRDSFQQARCLYVLGVHLSMEYEYLGNSTVMEEAIQVTANAIDLIPKNHYNMPIFLNSLSLRLRAYYTLTGKVEILEEGLRLSKQALTATPVTSPTFPALAGNRASLLSLHYSLTGQVTTLEDAIQLSQEALRYTPIGDQKRPKFYHYLSVFLCMYYDRTSEMASLSEAIRLSREAYAGTSDGSPAKADYSACLADCLFSRYRRINNLSDLKEAIATALISTIKAPSEHPRLPGMLDTLASCLMSRYDRNRKMADIDEAINIGQRVLDTTHTGIIYREGWISNQIVRLRTRYLIAMEGPELDQAIRLGSKTIALPITDTHRRAYVLFNLGVCQAVRGDKNALVSFNSAWNLPDVAPLLRVAAAGKCLTLLYAAGRHEEGMKLGFEILNLLPSVHTPSLQQGDEQEVMSTFAGIASELCALCIEKEEPEAALQSLEQGRAVIIGQLLSDSKDVPQLSKDRPDLAQRYEALTREVGAPTSSLTTLMRSNAVKRRRSEAMKALNDCLREIRDIAGYERFLLPLEQAEMHQCVDNGVVVVVNVTNMRSDAILLTAKDVRSLPLPDMSISKVKEWTGRDWKMKKRSEWQRTNHDFSKYLAWLWDVCVKHVVHAIENIHAPSPHSRPKVWWIGAGYANSMPLHAAGMHNGKSKDNAYDRLISSYTPSIKALAYARKQASCAMESRDTDCMLIATMPSTPKSLDEKKKPNDLPGVVHEAAEIVRVAGSNIMATVANGPSVEQILTALPTCRIAHFACHGTSDVTDPSNSSVIMQRKADNGTLEQDRLTVHQISNLRTERAQIAYLSACSTAENKATKLQDEVLHVVSAFQVSGFPHVVGCLWPAGDEQCVRVATKFYSLVLSPEGDKINREPARALRDAVMSLRDEDAEMPLLWAQFVHYGW